MGDDNALYSARIFLNAALPLIKVLVDERPELRRGFAGRSGTIQVSARDGAGRVGTHFVVSGGEVEVVLGLAERCDVELRFPSIAALNAFFSGRSKWLPAIRGAIRFPGLLIAFFRALLVMAASLGATEVPESVRDQELLVKLYFYLLTSGISQLNKAGHPEVSKWTKASPDRVYALAVQGRPDLAAYVRVKAGNTKAVRGVYERSKPFFILAFDTPQSALGTLLGKDEMLAATAEGRIVMMGGPEYGAQLGEFLLLVGSLAK